MFKLVTLPIVCVVAMVISLSSCYRVVCDRENVPSPPVPKYTRDWFPYFGGLGFSLANDSDTIHCTVLYVSNISMEYDNGDHCPVQRGEGIDGRVVVGADTLSFRSGHYFTQLSLEFRDQFYTLTDSALSQFTRDSSINSIAARVEILGEIFPRTVEARVLDSVGTTNLFISHGTGIAGAILDGKTYLLVQ